MKIEDGKLARRLLLVSRRCVNDEIALIAKEARAKLFMFAELRGAHGAVFTGESFAATDGPVGDVFFNSSICARTFATL